MTSPFSRATVVNVACAVGVVLTATVAHAQTTPPAAYAITKIPQFTREIWPADFNRDGRTDLIGADGRPSSGQPPRDLLLSLGRADRTFPAPQSLAIAAEPYSIADINADGFQDVVLRTADSLAVLPGRGDGTFAPPRTVAMFSPLPSWLTPFFAVVADFTGDGHRDIAYPTTEFAHETIRVLPGRGDFTFDTPRDTPMPSGVATSAITGDFNRDGRTDVAVTSGCCTISVLINNAGVAFAVTDIDTGADLSDITAGDLDRDGDLDLIAANYSVPYYPYEETGRILVLLGNGSGAFGAPVAYDTGLGGEFTVVAGDFTGDGLLDIATGAHSALRDPDDGPELGDSISVLVGNGTGGLGTVVAFRLSGDGFPSDPYRDTHNQLNTNDINRDGIPDLIASPGAILLSRPRAPSRPPVVSVGPDETLDNATPFLLIGHATDPDDHWLEYRWTDPGGQTISARPRVDLPDLTIPGMHTFTLTARDAFGGEASDSITLTVLPPRPEPLPDGWSATDVGAVAHPGLTVAGGGGFFSLLASGADVWGTRDEFHFASREWSPAVPTEVTARVTFVENVHPWTKAGIMIRNHLGANAAHAFLFVTPTTEKGVAFQRRRSDGASSVHTAGPARVAPIWLKLIVRGNVVRAYYRVDEGAATWTFLGQDTIAFGGTGPGAIGVALTSHVDGEYANASFTNVSIRPLENWIEADIGRTTAPGTGTSNDVRVTLEGAGADIWGTADAFRYRYRAGGTDPTVVTARVLSVENTHAWAKAGVMIRETTSPGSRHVMVIVSPGKGVAMQYRPEPNGPTLNAELTGQGVAPKWLRLFRIGRDFIGQMSEDGITWHVLQRVTLPIDGPMLEGIAVTSHSSSTELATAVFEDVSVERLP